MDISDSERFARALKEYGYLCSDLVDTSRLAAYWKVLKDAFTIEDFESICMALMMTEAQHRVPMPAVFLHKLRLFKDEQRQEDMSRRSKEEAEQRAAEQDRMAELLTDPAYAAEHAQAMQTCMRELDHILGCGWRLFADVMHAAQTPASRRLSAQTNTKDDL